MGWQIRHKALGVYQGQCMGLGFWHPTSKMPEQGFCDFPTRGDAEEYVAFLCSPRCSDPLKQEDLRVEPFDKEESDRLIEMGITELSNAVQTIGRNGRGA